LPKPSMIRMKFITIDRSIILKKIGKLSDKDKIEFTKIFINFFTN